jgi:hypothetical protein
MNAALSLDSPVKRNDYLDLRRRFEPDAVRLVIVAESPPASGRYFYDTTGSIKEPLFAALMKQLGVTPASKEEGLRAFQRRGWILVDATYEPVNYNRDRDAVIVRDYELLRDDLNELLTDRSVPLILIKKNVCEVLEPKLREDGFNVLNAGRVIYFPSTGRQREFHRQFQACRLTGSEA